MISVFAVSCLFGIGVQANHIIGEFKFCYRSTDRVTDENQGQTSNGSVFKFKSY